MSWPSYQHAIHRSTADAVFDFRLVHLCSMMQVLFACLDTGTIPFLSAAPPYRFWEADRVKALEDLFESCAAAVGWLADLGLWSADVPAEWRFHNNSQHRTAIRLGTGVVWQHQQYGIFLGSICFLKGLLWCSLKSKVSITMRKHQIAPPRNKLTMLPDARPTS